MAEKKKQHYVPKWYLKKFSIDGGDKINLFNVNQQKPIPAVPIKDQCYEEYYYGKDLKQENAFEKLEDAVARTVRCIEDSKELPPKMSEEYLVLFFYILSQDNRTKRAGEQQNEMTNKMWRTILRDNKELSAALQHWKIVEKIPTALPLYATATTWPLGFDLKMKIVVNKTKEGFITSDSPVVRYNQYMENFQAASCTGLASHGLQIFFPISPQSMLFLYDSSVYRVGKNGCDFCEDLADAEAIKLNELQWLNALENVYYSDETNLDSISAQAKRFLAHRRVDLSVVEAYEHVTDPRRSLIATRDLDWKTRLRPSFLRIMKSKSRIPLERRNPIRNEYMWVAWNQFEEEVEAGNYRDQDFLKFLAEKETSRMISRNHL
ncbi:MAG: DUF4238 domain-containing protein [Desulfomonilaceae bacterium]